MTNEERKRKAENRIALFLLEKGFSYIGGYDGKYSTLKVACPKCGEVFSQYYDPKVLFKRAQLNCPCCKQKEREIKQVQEEAERVKRREEYEKQLETWKKAREERELEKVHKMDELHTCPICSKTFTIREYAKSIGTDPIFISNVEYCSRKCKHKALRMSGRSRDHIKRAVRHGCEWERGVTLKKLLKRDGLRCSICGEMCDINDKSWGNGNGPRYPSMDHIIPIAKGGSHTWNNVQVAHLICNSTKNVKIV